MPMHICVHYLLGQFTAALAHADVPVNSKVEGLKPLLRPTIKFTKTVVKITFTLEPFSIETQ